MSYTVTKLNQIIVIKLTSFFTDTPLKLTFKVNGVSASSSLTATMSGNVHTWRIPLSSYHIGDELSSFRVFSNGTYSFAEKMEGVTLLLDDEEIATIHNKNYTIKFNDVGEHTIQAVYKGNKKLETAFSNKVTFFVNKDASSTTPTSSVYRIEYIDGKESYKYKDPNGNYVRVKLTYGGVPVGGATVKMSSSRGYTYTTKTLEDGTAKMRLYYVDSNNVQRTLDVGNHVLNTTYSVDGDVACSCQKELRVEKNDPIITYVHESGHETYTKGDQVIIQWTDPNGWVKDLAQAYYPVYINGKVYNVESNINARGWVRFTNAGTYNFKATFGGNSNLNAKTEEFTITVS